MSAGAGGAVNKDDLHCAIVLPSLAANLAGIRTIVRPDCRKKIRFFGTFVFCPSVQPSMRSEGSSEVMLDQPLKKCRNPTKDPYGCCNWRRCGSFLSENYELTSDQSRSMDRIECEISYRISTSTRALDKDAAGSVLQKVRAGRVSRTGCYKGWRWVAC